jgi:hypothetical protein
LVEHLGREVGGDELAGLAVVTPLRPTQQLNRERKVAGKQKKVFHKV